MCTFFIEHIKSNLCSTCPVK